MDILIKKATIINEDSAHHGKVKDILISKGLIEKIASNISAPKAKVVEGENLHVSLGWMDIGTYIGEPGYEHRETIDSAAKAAAAGGYTHIAVMPNVYPVTQTKSQISYIKHHQPSNGVKMLAIGAVSADAKGEDLTEMIDMAAAGAVAFSDGKHSITDSGMMMRALQYAKACNSVIINHPSDKALAHDGHIHEGEVSVSLGMQGIPAMSEHVAVHRDLQLADYTQSKLMLHCVSSSDTVSQLNEAKKTNQAVHASVSYLNLLNTDEDLKDFNSNLKVMPPLRSSKDKSALLKGIKNQTIDCIVTNHKPLEEEQKKLEFSYASPGATGLETCFAALNTFASKQLPLEKLIHALTVGPRKCLDMDIPELKTGAKACFTIFTPTAKWTYTTRNKKSISANNPYLDQELTGKVIAIVNGNKCVIQK